MLCGCATLCLSTDQLMNICVVFTFSLLYIMLLCTFIYKLLCECIYIGVEFLGHVVTLFYFCNLFSSFFISLWTQAICWLFVLAILIDVEQYLIMALIHVYLMACGTEQLFMSLWAMCMSLEKCMCICVAHFLLSFFVFVELKGSFI
jgi:hypothetical protein